MNEDERRGRATRRRLERMVAAAACGALLLGLSAGCAPRASLPTAPATRLKEVTGDEAVTIDAKSVTTACFSYDLPRERSWWKAVDGTQGCLTGIAFDDDVLSLIRVKAELSSGTAAELGAERLRLGARDTSDQRLDVISLGGREVGRVITPWEAGLEIASYSIPYPESGLVHEGDDIGAIVIVTMYSADYEAMVEDIIHSLRRPDGTPV